MPLFVSLGYSWFSEQSKITDGYSISGKSVLERCTPFDLTVASYVQRLCGKPSLLPYLVHASSSVYVLWEEEARCNIPVSGFENTFQGGLLFSHAEFLSVAFFVLSRQLVCLSCSECTTTAAQLMPAGKRLDRWRRLRAARKVSPMLTMTCFRLPSRPKEGQIAMLTLNDWHCSVVIPAEGWAL